jgi:hypothetical protein
VKPDCWKTVWQIGDVEERDPVTGLLYNYADEFNWIGATPTAAGPGLSFVKPPFTNPFIVGTTPTNEFPYNSNASVANNYATNFDVKWSGKLKSGGKLTISWSPGQSAFEKKVVSDGFPEQTLTATGTPRPEEGWFLNKYSLVEHLIMVNPLPKGEHTINFKHTQGDGTFWDWIRLEEPCDVEETAWAEGDDTFEQGWGSYYECCIPECNKWVVYGTSLGGSGTGDKIYEIDLATLTATELFNTGLNTGDGNWPNGNAYDPQNNRLYYSVKPNKLYYYDFAGNQVDATNGNTTPGDVACGSFYNGKYYYIPQNSSNLYQVTLDASSGFITSVDNIQTYTGKTFSFGDVVVSLDGSILYGSSAVNGTGTFWSIKLSDYSYTYISNMAHMQLAYGSDGRLYGHDAGNANFYVIDESAGTRTLLGVLNTGPSGGKFTDLASGPQWRRGCYINF